MDTKRFLLCLGLSLLTILTLFLNAFPNYYAGRHRPAGMSYSGQASWFDPWDINVYISAIGWGQRGNILVENAFTTLSHKPVLLYPLYTMAGAILPDAPPFLLFHVLSVITGGLMVLTVWQMAKIFIPSEGGSLLAAFLTALGGGLGWLLFPKVQSSDLYMTGFTFTSQFQRPHEALGVILYILSLVLFYLGIARNKTIYNTGSLFALSLLILFYPYYFLSYALICGVYAFYLYSEGEKGPFKSLILNLAIITPFLLIYYLHLRSSKGFGGVIGQQLKTPNILQILLGYGVFSPLLFLQLVKKDNKDDRYFFLNIWFFASLLLAYLPVGFSRFYLRSLFFPATLLSILFLSEKIEERNRRILKIILVVGAVALVPLSNYFMTYKRIAEVKRDNRWFYITREEQQALRYLDENSAADSGVLAWYTLGNYIPAKTDNRVYFGHLLQTPDAENKLQNVYRFYTNQFSDEKVKKFLKDEGIRYIMWGPEEKNILLSNTEDKTLKYPVLKPIFTNEKVTLFSVR